MKITDFEKKQRPITAVQFGGGVFLRGFFDWMLAKANASGAYSGNVMIVRSRTRGADPLAEQNFMYTHVARDGDGCESVLVDCIEGSLDPSTDPEGFAALATTPELSLAVSNTTEAGIVYEACEKPCGNVPDSFPARLAYLLYLRFSAGLPGLLVLPCELIENNGEVLRDIILRHAADWKLEDAFSAFVKTECSFRNTLVDRIVSGAPGEPIDLGYEDALVNTSEAFHLWVIEGEEDERLPFAALGMNVKWVPAISPYRTLKVRILNGAHTSMIPYALLSGVETVGACMADKTLRAFLEACLAEILPTLDFDCDEARGYAEQVIKRFENPHIHHLCSAISLNSVSKFRVRVLPSIKAYYEKFGTYPRALVYSFSRLIAFYREGAPRDDDDVIARMQGKLADVLADSGLWGEDLSDMTDAVASAEWR